MNRNDFELLRNLPGKVISADVEFVVRTDSRPNLTFEQVRVENDLGYDVTLNGTYKPLIPSVTINFVIRGVGPICRIDVNGPKHGDAGRTHKHDLREEECPRRNLPHAVPRPDLADKTPTEVWRIIREQANIVHTGAFRDPRELFP